jgi:hypothetical protein
MKFSHRDSQGREYDHWSRTDQFIDDLEKGVGATFVVVGLLFVAIFILFVIVIFIAIIADGNRPVNLGDQLQKELKKVDKSKKSTGWLWGSEYRVSGQEAEVAKNGDKAWKVYVETDATSKEDFREIASEIAEEGPVVGFFWVEFYKDSKTNTTGAVLDFNSQTYLPMLGPKNQDRYSVDGGANGDGVYVWTAEELDDGWPEYPSGERFFEPVN